MERDIMVPPKKSNNPESGQSKEKKSKKNSPGDQTRNQLRNIKSGENFGYLPGYLSKLYLLLQATVASGQLNYSNVSEMNFSSLRFKTYKP